jgi:hypothetical protein
MAKTLLFDVGPTPMPIRVHIANCARIDIGEDASNPNYPSILWGIAQPTAADDYRTVNKGSTFSFFNTVGGWRPGFIIGYIKALSGSATFFQHEFDATGL